MNGLRGRTISWLISCAALVAIGANCSDMPDGDGREGVKSRVTPTQSQPASGSATADAGIAKVESTWPRTFTVPVVEANSISGFVMPDTASKFPVGANPISTVLNGGAETRRDGALGTAIRFSNGFWMARPGAHSPTKTAGPLSTDPNQHNDRVRRYFADAGLPDEQVGEVGVTTDMEELWDGTTEAMAARTFLGYSTVIGRKVDDVPVVGSRAWAQFNTNDEVVAEEVWWPPLPGSLLQEIASYRQLMSDDSTMSLLRAKLPLGLSGSPARLAIHHSEPRDRGWYAVVTIDFAQQGGPLNISMDKKGRLLRFAPTEPPPNVAK